MTALPTASTAGADNSRPVLNKRSTRARRWMITLFLIPTVVGLTVFMLLPIVGSVILSFFHWDIISPPSFAGLSNYADIGSNPTIRRAFLNTIAFVIIVVVIQLALSLALAVLVQSKMPSALRTFFRSAFFFPLILSAASVSLVMSYLFNSDFGLVNKVLGFIGIPAVGWLTTGAGAVFVILFVFIWQNFGFTFLLFLGGLASIPVELYEASSVDGVGPWQKFRHITLPLLSPTTLVASVMATIAALQIFDQPWVLTKGGPGDSTRTAVMTVYQSAFENLAFGQAFAIGVVLTLIIMAITGLQFILSRKFVHYQ